MEQHYINTEILFLFRCMSSLQTTYFSVNWLRTNDRAHASTSTQKFTSKGGNSEVKKGGACCKQEA